MNGRLAGRVVLVTGGCGDIGRATAIACRREGATVVLADIATPDEAQQRLGALHAEIALYIPCDVRDFQAGQRVIAEIAQRFGGPDVTIANAGITRSMPALQVSQDDWQQVLDVNLSGAFYVAQQASAALVRQGRPGVLLFTGSWIGQVPSKDLLPYCVSKAGVQMVARCLALELAPYGIRANVVAPGILDAGVSAEIFRAFPERREPFERMVPLGMLGTAEQVAEALVFLASDAAAYVTGATLLVDGGASLFQFQR